MSGTEAPQRPLELPAVMKGMKIKPFSQRWPLSPGAPGWLAAEGLTMPVSKEQ